MQKGVIGISRYNSEWDRVTLSDPITIKGLMKFRHKYSPLSDGTIGRYGVGSNADLCGMTEDVICTYADLDALVDKAGFNEYQSEILDMYKIGYTEGDIADELNVGMQSINKVIDNMCEVLSKLNYENWKFNYVFWNKVKVSSDYKMCSKCEEFLPITKEYFSPRTDNKGGGFYSYCRKCGLISQM